MNHARPWRRPHRAWLVLFAILVAALFLTRAGGRAEAVPAGNRIPWQGSSYYLHGANVPWFNWAQDFGGGTANGGVSSASVQSALAPVFQQAQSANLHTIRWWVFEGDPWQVTRDSTTGVPTGIDPAVYADFDAALQLAQTYDLYYDFVLFSAPSALPPAWLSDTTQRLALATALGQLFAHYRGNPHILSWEVFNEPDFDVWNGKVAQSDMADTVKAIVDSIHTAGTAYATVGMGYADGLSMVTGLGLDYYQAHWYDYMSGGTYCMRCNDYAFYQTKFNLDAPLVVGEFSAGPDTDALQRFTDFDTKGYAGAWSWSLFPSHTSDGLAIDWTAAGTFGSQHRDIGPSAGFSIPTAPTGLHLGGTSTGTTIPLAWSDMSTNENRFQAASIWSSPGTS